MSEQLKFIVDKLNQEPFKRSYNLISFDSLQPLHLLQVLNDIFADIDNKHKIDLREEDPEQMAVRMFGFLRILKYKPKTDAGNLNAFRQGLVAGDKPVVYPIMQWLLEHLDELKKRAYLAKYLVRIDLPGEVLAEPDVYELNENYVGLIEMFKENHKILEQLKGSGFSTAEIKKDILSMEEEKEQLRKRLERLQKKVESTKNYEKMLEAARNLRIEQENEQNLNQQKMEQKGQLIQNEQRVQRMQQQLKDMRAQGVGITAADLVKRLEEESKVNTYLCNEKLPKEIEGKRKIVNDYQRVVDEPAMGQSDLDELNKQIKALNSEINGLIEKRMVRNDPIDDKLSLFRQQASIIARKKEAAGEKLHDAMDELQSLESEVAKKREVIKEADGEEILKGDEFKRYVNKLRGKSTIYKKKRQEIAELRAEYGVLSRTEELLRAKDDFLQHHIASIEARKGVAGAQDTQEELEKVSALKSDLDEQKGKTLEDISEMVRKLTTTITDKKNALAPIIKELRPMRQKVQELTQDYEEKKSHYDNLATGLESNMHKLEQEVRGLREELAHEESRYHYIQCMIKVLDIQQQRIQEEMKSYTMSDSADRKKSFRELYSKKISEQENLGKNLKDRQKAVRESHGPNMKQMKMWNDLAKLLQCKKDCAVKEINEHSGQFNAIMGSQVEEDRLIL